jgi:hypothetical protein
VVNVAAVFGAIHTRWFERLGVSPVSIPGHGCC